MEGLENLEMRYMERLSQLYPTIASASTEIINLEAILHLPKGTEHFLTDIHGEYEAFAHVLKNGSGSVRRKIDEVFGNTLSINDKKGLATLIYYPREKMEEIEKIEDHTDDWYKITLYRLVQICKRAASKYTRSKVRKALPKDFAYVIEELLTEKPNLADKQVYYNSIIETIIKLGRAQDFIAAMSELIQRLVVDHLHIVGDIYDRGPGPHIIMDKLKEYHSVDIQWGNHDVLWMGAAAGQRCCIATVIRICARYGNLDILEDGYGINLLPLATFATNTYKDDPCSCFKLKGYSSYNPIEIKNDIKMHKAISIIQFKLEGQLIKENPEFRLDDRRLMHLVDYEKGTINIDGKTYHLLDTNFPTVDEKDPYKLTPEEEDIMERLESAFLRCEKLQEHIRFLLTKGNLYKVYNENLLYHGCMPLNEKGGFKEVKMGDKTYKGKSLYENIERWIRKGFFASDKKEREMGKNLIWCTWLHPDSPLFGKSKMATWERYFLKEKCTHKELKNPYYTFLEDEKIMDQILIEFGLDSEESHIVNGHVPVKMKDGESPIKCKGKVLVIDGGFARAYQKETGLAGYTLIYNSYGMIIAAHEPFKSLEETIKNESDIYSDTFLVQRAQNRKLVADTDIGKAIKSQIYELEKLLEAYREGDITEKR